MREQTDLSFVIERVIPLDCILECIQERTDRFKLVAIGLDEYGCYEIEIKDGSSQHITREIEVGAPKPEKNVSKKETKNAFQESMNNFAAALDGLISSGILNGEDHTQRDLSYLDILPDSLTHNAVLDLNNVLQDKPIHDELYHEAKKFLGNDAFLLEESLRDGYDENNGILFAAGKQGYIWIRGRKKGRYLEDVLVDKVEWDNIKCFVHQWQEDDGQIKAVYTLQKGTKELVVPYVWSPRIDVSMQDYQWLLQKLNGPWIVADIMYKYLVRCVAINKGVSI